MGKFKLFKNDVDPFAMEKKLKQKKKLFLRDYFKIYFLNEKKELELVFEN